MAMAKKLQYDLRQSDEAIDQILNENVLKINY